MQSRFWGKRLYYPPATWFNIPVTSASGVASTPGTWEWAAGAEYGRINIETTKTILASHLHIEVDAITSGSLDVELWRHRGQTFGPGGPGTFLLIANASQAQGAGNGTVTPMTFVDESYKTLISGDYLHMQITDTMAGGSWRAFVDIHWVAVSG